MSEGFYGIDPQGLRTLAFQIDWTQADVARQAGIAYESLTRHSRWATADGTGTQLSHVSRWGRLQVEDMRSRAAAIELAQQINIFGSPTLISGPWFPLDGGGLGPTLPYFPFGTPSDYANATDIPWDEIEDWVRGALGVWNGGDDGSFPIGRWVGGVFYMNRVRRFMQGSGPLPTIANGWFARQLANTRYFSWINNPAVQTVGRRVSIGLSVYSTVADGIVVWNHGNPIDAFEEHGAGYVADVARLGFSASTTAFLIAPNPVTGALVIVTGTVWAVAEIVDHWDEVTEFFGDVGHGVVVAGEGIADATVWVVDETGQLVDAGWDWTTDRWDDVTGWGGEQWSDFTGWGEGQLDNLSREYHDFIDWGGEQWSDFTGWGESQLDNLSREFGEFKDWSGDQVDNVVDWGGDRIEDAKDFAEDVGEFAGDAKDTVVDLADDGLDLVGDGVGALGDGLGAVGGGISKLWGG